MADSAARPEAETEQERPASRRSRRPRAWYERRWDLLRAERHEVPSGGSIALLVLDDPERRNTMTTTMTASWAGAVAAVADDDDVRAVVVTGAGSAFCAGGDLGWLADGAGAGAGGGGTTAADVERLRRRMAAFYREWLSVAELPVPVVAAVNGHAVGAGLALALACDVRVVAEGARLSAPFARLGLHPGMASTWSLVRVAGLGVAQDLLLTGRVVQGDEVLRLGLATRLVPDDQVLEEAMGAAESAAGGAPVAVRLTKASLSAVAPDLGAALEREALAQAVTLTGEDLSEGLAAQREHRAPRFSGR